MQSNGEPYEKAKTGARGPTRYNDYGRYETMGMARVFNLQHHRRLHLNLRHRLCHSVISL